MAKQSRRVGPALDEQAEAEILQEEALHKKNLLGLERQQTDQWPQLLADENDRHLKKLTRIYSALANRRLETRPPE